MIPHSWSLKPPLGWVTFARRLRSQKTQGREVLRWRWGKRVFWFFFFGDKIWSWTRETNIYIYMYVYVYSPTWIDYLWQLLSGEIWHHAWGGITFWGTWKRPIYLEIKTTWQVSSLKIRRFVRFLPSFSEQPQAQNNLKKNLENAEEIFQNLLSTGSPRVTSRYCPSKKSSAI